MRPSDETVERAAEVLSRMGQIPGLEGGIAAFYGVDLELLRWHEVTDDHDRLDGGVYAHVLPASAFRGLYRWREKLLETCRSRSEMASGIARQRSSAP
jgi:hypothetical protein